jgi:hypothetical protein
MIRPTLLLQMNLDEKQYSEETVAEIKRSYAYVAPCTVASHAQTTPFAENTLRFLVKIRQPYWNSFDEGADETWDGVMCQWLSNMFYKTSSTMSAYNNNRIAKNEPTLVFTWLVIELGNLSVTLKLNADSSVPESAVELISRLRTLMNTGKLAEGVAADETIIGVSMPSRKSYESGQGSNASIAGDEAAGEADTEDALEGQAELTPESVNFTIWGIEYQNGTNREFDSEQEVFLS